MRVRGLKRDHRPRNGRTVLVAPRAGAWVETHSQTALISLVLSHPVRVRGLKLLNIVLAHIVQESHPVRVRGLKLDEFWERYPKKRSHPVRVRGLKLDTAQDRAGQ